LIVRRVRSGRIAIALRRIFRSLNSAFNVAHRAFDFRQSLFRREPI
jgi:hypothetical protein